MIKCNWDGLTLAEVIKQSAAIHPDWTPADHRDHILSDTAFDTDDLRLLVSDVSTPSRTFTQMPAQTKSEACRFPSGCHYRVLDGQQLCFEHQVNITRLMATR